MEQAKIRATTVVCCIKEGKAALGSDGQVTLGNTIMKHTTSKIRTLHNGKIVVGFAGSTADAFALLQKFEEKLESHTGKLDRASIELAKEWRTDRYLRRLEAMMIATDGKKAFLLSGTGDVIESDNNILAIGSGGPYAQAAAMALSEHSKLSPKEIVEESLKIAGTIDIYTNTSINVIEI